MCHAWVMRPSTTREGYALIAEQFIRAVGVLAVQQALGEESRRVETVALSRPVFQMALKNVSEIITVRRGNSNEFGVSYNIKLPRFPASMSAGERGGFRAIYASILTQTLGFKVTEFAPHTTDVESLDLRLCDVQHQALLDQVAMFNKLSERAR